MGTIESLLERKLLCEIIQFEGVEAVKSKIFWNWQGCTYGEICLLKKEKEKHQPKPCSYNPKMFKCPAYQFYAINEE